MLQVMLVDDVPVFRRMLRAVLERQGDITVVAEAETGAEAIELYHVYRPDVVALDLYLPDLSGIEVMRRLRQLDPHVKALAVTGSSDAQWTRSAVAAGAVGVIQKPIDPRRLVASIHAAAAGQPPPPEAGDPLAETAADPDQKQVLLVDPDALFCRIMSHALRHAGYRVAAQAAAADEAVALHLELQPDVTIVEARLGHPDGLWVVRHIIKAQPDAAVVMVSGGCDQALLQQVRDAGAAACVAKPVEYDQFFSLLAHLLNPDVAAPLPPRARRPGAKQASTEPPPSALGASRPRVLVVEDAPTTQKILAKLIEKAGGEVSGTATTAQGALKLFAEQTPDVVSLDLGLAAGNGFEFLAQLRLEHPDALVVVVSSHSRPELIAAAMSFGVIGYITKPFDTQYVISVMQAAFAKLAARGSAAD